MLTPEQQDKIIRLLVQAGQPITSAQNEPYAQAAKIIADSDAANSTTDPQANPVEL